MKTLESGDKYAVTAFDALDGVAIVSFIDSARGGDTYSIEFQNGYELDRFIRRLKFERNEVFGR